VLDHYPLPKNPSGITLSITTFYSMAPPMGVRTSFVVNCVRLRSFPTPLVYELVDLRVVVISVITLSVLSELTFGDINVKSGALLYSSVAYNCLS